MANSHWGWSKILPLTAIFFLAIQFMPQLLPINTSENLLDDCYHVYLDMGTNTGVQIRKLYQPHLFGKKDNLSTRELPEPKVAPIFNKFFGPPANRHMVCAVGWEPNWEHTSSLTKLQESFNACGWRVKIFTETGVGKANEKSRYANINQVFYDLKGEAERCKETGCKQIEYYVAPFEKGVAGRLVKSDREAKWLEAAKVTEVEVMRIADFITGTVAKRRIPQAVDGKLPPAVVMKLDVEGREVDIMPDLVMSGAFGQIDSLMVDWTDSLNDGMQPRSQTVMNQRLRKALEELVELSLALDLHRVTEVIPLDDETYSSFDGDLPQC